MLCYDLKSQTFHRGKLHVGDGSGQGSSPDHSLQRGQAERCSIGGRETQIRLRTVVIFVLGRVDRDENKL